MSYTATLNEKTVFGNLRCCVFEVTADGATGTIATGLTQIRGHAIGPISMNSGAPLAKVSGGTVTVSAATTGDNFYLTVFGR